MTFDIVQFLESIVKLEMFDYLSKVWAGDVPSWLINGVSDIAGVLIICTFNLLIVLFLIWFERKIIARIQDRIGPNRVGGRYGLLQPVADAMKLMTKEDLTPAGADKIAFNLAPLIVVVAALMMWAVIPFAPGVSGTNLNVGVFYILAISSVSVVALILAGWGSNNKYALLGAFRSVAQLVSYEVPMIMALLIPIILAGTMSTQGIVIQQSIWYVFVVPLSALIFFISALAELGRTPFDLLEAESEIVAGYHIEYSGMKFAMFFLAEFIGTLFMAALFTTIYLGGWRGPGAVQYPILGLFYFSLKMFFVYFLFVWIRGTLPRVRIDQLLNLNWKFLVPLVLALILVVALVSKTMEGAEEWKTAAVLLLSNLILGLLALDFIRRYARQQRSESEEVVEVEETIDTQTVTTAAH
ncbi:MAG TPA: NADH-quinone oxidoreductase subunit NuoH [candidate division Zixibacteria bacterium]|nr:NADH-quinone oxidoreductase subunit NuoH [candidate division Zixibacteria bacterium]